MRRASNVESGRLGRRRGSMHCLLQRTTRPIGTLHGPSSRRRPIALVAASGSCRHVTMSRCHPGSRRKFAETFCRPLATQRGSFTLCGRQSFTTSMDPGARSLNTMNSGPIQLHCMRSWRLRRQTILRNAEQKQRNRRLSSDVWSDPPVHKHSAFIGETRLGTTCYQTSVPDEARA